MKFYQLSPQKRREFLAKNYPLNEIDDSTLKKLDQLSENVVSQLRLPLSVVFDVLVNDKSFTIPMATEEASVVAAANHGVRIFAKNGGCRVVNQRDGIYGQIVLEVAENFDLAKLETKFDQLIEAANTEFASLVKHGGGVKQINGYLKDNLLSLRVLVDPAQAMGANKTNAILEFLGQKLEDSPNIKQKLYAILSNYPSQFAIAKVKIDPKTIGGIKVAQKIALLSQIGYEDPYRAVTNNKGIMNGVDAILLATGNDFRAVEASCAVLASQDGQYRSLSKWRFNDGFLIGELTLPLAIGTVGGSITSRQDVMQAFEFLGKISSEELAACIVTIGLANNFAALLAISTVGIQRGHMKLQARNLVANLQATQAEKKAVLKLMRQNRTYSQEFAQKYLKEIKGE